MKITFALLSVACAFFFCISAASAADQDESMSGGPGGTEQSAPDQEVGGFGSGTGFGAGGALASPGSVGGGMGSTTGNSGAGTQSFGAGFTQQQAPGSLLAPAAPGGAGGGAAGGTPSTLIP